MDHYEKVNWFMGICASYCLVFFGCILTGVVIYLTNLSLSMPQKISFTLEQLQVNPCLGCQQFKFQQTLKGEQYCCRIKDIDILKHPTQCNTKLFCLDQGTNELNQYTQEYQLYQEKLGQIRICWFIFWGLNIIGLILLGLYLMRYIYLIRFQRPRPFQRLRQYLSRIIAERRMPLKKTNIDFLNEEMETKNPCFDKQQVARQVKE